MKTNQKEKVCSCCGHILKPNEGIHVGYMDHEMLDHRVYMFNCHCGGTLAEKHPKNNQESELK